MQKASSLLQLQKVSEFYIKNIYCFHKHGKFQTFDLCSFPSNLTEVTKKGEAGAPAAGSAPAEGEERLLEMCTSQNTLA